MNAQTMTRNTLAGITTSLAMVPEVVAFALLAHVNCYCDHIYIQFGFCCFIRHFTNKYVILLETH